jgi:hypothetical protein
MIISIADKSTNELYLILVMNYISYNIYPELEDMSMEGKPQNDGVQGGISNHETVIPPRVKKYDKISYEVRSPIVT